MQARPGAQDELPRSGALEDAGSNTDHIQQELDEAGSPPKQTRNSPRLRPGPAPAHRRRPNQPRAEAQAHQLALGTLRRLVPENSSRPAE